LLRVREASAKGASPTEISAQDERIRVLNEAISDDRATKSAAVQRVDSVIRTLRENVSQFQKEMCNSFNETIKAFLAEECTLDYRTAARKIGQSQDDLMIEFPEFVVRMTSGVFKVDSEIRESPSSVSESQREFIELAFRMAFLSVSAKQSPCTLILDTPESSLDAVFIPRAGAAFHGFAHGGSEPRAVLAASNLNGTAMIPSMLGISTPSETAKKIGERVLNLLNVAARGRAFDVYADEYDVALKRALQRPNI
jgi:hypothetical protein